VGLTHVNRLLGTQMKELSYLLLLALDIIVSSLGEITITSLVAWFFLACPTNRRRAAREHCGNTERGNHALSHQ